MLKRKQEIEEMMDGMNDKDEIKLVGDKYKRDLMLIDTNISNALKDIENSRNQMDSKASILLESLNDSNNQYSNNNNVKSNDVNNNIGTIVKESIDEIKRKMKDFEKAKREEKILERLETNEKDIRDMKKRLAMKDDEIREVNNRLDETYDGIQGINIEVNRRSQEFMQNMETFEYVNKEQFNKLKSMIKGDNYNSSNKVGHEVDSNSLRAEVTNLSSTTSQLFNIINSQGKELVALKKVNPGSNNPFNNNNGESNGNSSGISGNNRKKRRTKDDSINDLQDLQRRFQFSKNLS